MFLFFYNRDLTKLEDGIGDKVVQFMHFMASFVGCLVLAFTKGWLLALVCLSSLPVTLVAVGTVSVVQYPLHSLLLFKPSFFI
jgi:ATP-binding cassette subfamily B (MDR/TAP) protein 1